MSAVFTGNGLGLFNTSLTQLGGALGGSGGLGQDRSRQLVNLATGNLLLQGQDEFLSFRGLGVGFNRTYNSNGLSSEVGTDGWVTGFERRVALLSGTFNTAGSVMRRYTGDGAYQDFTYVSANTYQATGGDGAHDTLSWGSGSSTWTYVEGSTRREELYADHANATLLGRLTRIRDLKSDGTTPVTWDVLYNASNQISEIQANDGTATRDALIFGYDGNGRLSSVSTRENGTVRSQVTYGYDAQGRLSSVTTDLTPDVTTDNTWSATPANNNGKLYRTEYTYESTTLRLASLKQSDGTLVSYTYHADGRVKTVTQGDSNTNDADGLGETTTYTYGAGSTTVADSLGRAWAYAYDANGQLTSVTSPAVAGQSDITTYQYDASGNVTQAKTVRGAATLSLLDYQYDASGNLTWQWDAQGNAISRTYSATNQLLTETRYTGVDPDRTGAGLPTGGMSANYVYDAQNRVRFVVNALGEVTEFTYATSGNGIGQQSAVRQYLSAGYSGTMTEAALNAWATPPLEGQGTLSEFTYDLWGRLSQRNDYAAVDTNGLGVLDAATALTRYTYDAQGLLRQQIVLRGTSRSVAGAALAGSELTDYAYDGMGRLLSVLSRDSGVTSSDATSVQTTYAYLDSAYQIAVTTDAGAVTTQTRNAAGRVVSISQVGTVSGATVTRTTQNWYDKVGQLRISQDAGGGRSYFFYDDKGRLEATADATGAVVQTIYDGADQVVQTRAYANRVTTAGWTSLTAVPANFSAIGVAADDTLDRVFRSAYDAGGRLIATTDGLVNTAIRTVTEYTYDGAGRLLQSKQTDTAHTEATARTQRYFYDNAGRLIGTLDAEGYLTESAYDRVGRLVSQVRYATVSPSAQWTAGTLVQLRPATNAANDQTTRHYYNGRGQLVGTLDAQGYLTELVVDEAGNISAERRYNTAVTWVSTDTLSTLRGRAGANSYRESRMAYNGLGQLITQINAQNTVTRYTYDEAGRLVKTEAAQGTTEVRENNRRYNVFGELIGELAGEGSVQLLAGMSETQLDAVYAQYGERHNYDALGRRIESIDAEGNKTWYFYDGVSRLTFTVKGVADSGNVRNAQGEVIETRYTAFGDVGESLTYTGRITIPVPGDRNSVLGAIGTLSYDNALDARRAYAYDVRGLLASQTDYRGWQTTYVRDAFGDLKQQTVQINNTQSVKTAYTYDQRGLLLTQTGDPGGLGQLRSWSYDAFGRAIGQVDGRGNAISYGYDRLGRQINTSQVVSGRTETITTGYDAHHRVVNVTDAKGQTTTHAYDDVSLTATVTTPEGVVMVTRLNRHGDVWKLVDGENNTIEYLYNRNGQLKQAIDANGRTTANTYDVRGLLSSTLDASGRTVEYRYDAVGRVLSRIEDPAGLSLTTTYAYDGQSRTVRVTDPEGVVTTTTYTCQNKVGTVVRDDGGLALTTTYEWDKYDRELVVTEGYGTVAAHVTQYTYDALGRRISETVDPSGLNLTTAYAYDKNDNVIRRTDANGAVTRYYYDEANRLIYTVDPLGGMTRNWYDINGRLAAVRSFSQKITTAQLAALADASTIAQLDLLVVWKPDDLSQYQVHDNDGRLIYEIGLRGNSVRQRLYDAAGRALGTRDYAMDYTLQILSFAAQLLAGAVTSDDIASSLSANDALDQRSWQVLDAAGQARYHIDSLGNVEETYYDAAGRVAGTRRFAAAIALDATLRGKLSDGTVALTDISSRLSVNDVKDLRSYQVFDAAGRLRYAIDALGAVQEYSLDATGRTVATRRYAQAIAVDATLLGKLKAGTATVADVSVKLTANDALDGRGYQVFDAAGRLRLSIDAQGNAQELRYDAVGRVIQQLAYGTAIAAATLTANLAALKAGTVSVATAVGWVSSQEATARMTTLIWDTVGRLRYTLARTGTVYTVSESRYDAVGRVIAQVAYAKTIPTATAGTVADIAAAVTTAGGDTAANQRLTRLVYDAQGRVRFTVDDLGGVSEQRYDALGRVVESRQYGLRIATSTAATEAAVAAAVAGQSGVNVRSTLTTYNSVGQVLTVTDAAGKTESYGYDPLGNRISYTNKLGAVWTYAYDAAGRRISETSPAIKVAVTDNVGTVSIVTRAVVTQIAYDALGNVIQRTEDATGAKARITQYQYDNRGHQIKTIFPDAGLIDPNTGAINATGVSPTIEVTYNALGQAVVQKDVRGNYSYKTYDALGQLACEVDQEGYATGYAYNAFGEQATLRRYATALNFAGISGWTAGTAITASQLTATVLVANASQDRLLTTSYDSLGQQTQVLQSAVSYVKIDGTTATGTPTTQFTYNLYGEVVKTSVLVDAASNLWANTYQYYDELGHTTMTVDAEGYVTVQAYDALGQATQVTEHARALSSAVLAALTTTAAPAAPTAGDAVTTGYDRITRWEYDAMGRKTGEIVARHYQYADGSAGLRDIKTAYTYDAEGRATAVTSDAGTSWAAITTTEYDALDRVVSVKEPVRSTLLTTAEGQLIGSINNNLGSASLYAQVSPYTTMAYDAFGNLSSVRRYANGWVSGAPSAVADNTRDQVQVTRYDWQGRAVWDKDPEGNITTRTYDAADHLLTTMYGLAGNNSTWAMAVNTAAYDEVGRQISNTVVRSLFDGLTPIGTVTDSSESVKYNAFGEITEKGYTSASRPLVYTYDQAGRVVSNNETGATRNYGYNLAGHQVKESHSVYVGSGNVTATTRFVTDRLGRTTQLFLPSHTSDAALVNTMTQKVDRWGNVIEVVDPRGYKTNYEYNDQNRLIHEIQPLVTVVETSTTGTALRPEREWFYDALGRLVGTRDANDNLTQYQYDAGGQRTRVIEANGATTLTAYDALGLDRFAQNALGYVTYKQYNRLGHVTGHGDYLTNAAGTARDKKTQESYVLNINGDRVQVTNALNKVTKYDYDSRGLLLRSESQEGVVMEYAYDQAGRRARETYNLVHTGSTDRDGEAIRLNEQTWDYDYFGRLIDHNDLSGRDYNYTYEANSGQLTTETNSTGLSRTTTYFANGQVREVQEAGGLTIYRYEYDASGNRTVEQTITTDSQNKQFNVRTEIAYDSHNRMQQIVQDDLLTNKRGLDLTYDYDAVGNRTRVVARSGYGMPVNQAPVYAGTLTDRTLQHGVSVDFVLPAGAFTDMDGEALTYTAEVLVNTTWVPLSQLGLSINASTGRITGTATNLTKTSYSARITATDGHNATATGTYTFNVTNTPPSPSAIPTQSTFRSVLFSVNAANYFSDVNSNPLTYSATGLPAGLTINASTGVISGAVTAAIGNYNITVTANDGNGGTASTSFQLQVAAAPAGNIAPVVQHPIADEWSMYQTDWTMTVPSNTFYDANGDTLTYSASNMPSGMTFDPATRTFAMFTRKSTLGFTYNNITVTVTDGNGGTASISFTLVVEPYEDTGDPPLVVDPGTEDEDLPGTESLVGIQSVTEPEGTAIQAWYAYDSLNRMVVSNGQLYNGAVVLRQGGDSYSLAYDLAGNQTSQQRLSSTNGTTWYTTTVQKQYSQRGELTLTIGLGQAGMGQGTQITERRFYDDAGREIKRLEYFGPGSAIAWVDSEGMVDNGDVGGWLKSSEVTTYDDDGRVLTQTTKTRPRGTISRHVYGTGPFDPPMEFPLWVANAMEEEGGLLDQESETVLVAGSTISYASSASTGYDVAGRLLGYTYRDDVIGYTNTYKYKNYGAWDSYREGLVEGSSTDSNYRTTTSTMTYNAATGRQTEIREHTNGVTMDDRIRSFAYDGNGMILSRRDGTWHNNVFTQTGTGAVLGRMNLHNVYANGQQVAALDEAVKLDVLGQLTGFSNSESGSTLVTVQAGETTLREVAQRVYGDADLWYVIAEANALGESEGLVAGTTLSVPEVKTSSNDAQTFKPYNPSEITGPTSPGLPYIEPPDKGCSGIAMVLMVIAVVVACVVAPYIAPVVAQMGATGAVAVGLTAGMSMAVGSAVSQGIGSVTGVSTFSWKQVAVDGIVAGLTAGVGNWAQGAKYLSQAGKLTTFGKVFQGVASYGSSVVANVVVGRDTNFSWSSVAATAASAYLGAKLGLDKPMSITSGATQIGRFINNYPGALVNASISATARRLVGGGNQDWSQIAVDAFGNAFAGASVEGINNWQANRIQDWQADRATAPVISRSNSSGLNLANPNYRPDWLYGDEYAATGTSGDWNDWGSGESFLDRYPYATASLANGDVRRSNSIDPGMLAQGNAILRRANGGDIGESPYPIHAGGGLLWGNGDMTYGLGADPVIVTEALPDAGASQMPTTLAPIENLYAPYDGWWSGRFNTFSAMFDDPDGSWQQKTGGVAGGILTAIPAMADLLIKGVYDAPNNAGLAGQKWGQASFLSGHDAALANLEGFQYFLAGFQGVGDAVTLATTGAIGPKPPSAISTIGREQIFVANSELRAFTYNAVENPGPLANLPNNPAANFFGGRYNSSVLTEDLVLYRGGKIGEPLGQWFTREAPESVAQIRIDSAVKDQWIDPKTGYFTGSSTIDNLYAIKIPKGTTIYEGPVGYQGGVYLGGPNTNQVFVQTPWKIPGVQELWWKPIK